MQEHFYTTLGGQLIFQSARRRKNTKTPRGSVRAGRENYLTSSSYIVQRSDSAFRQAL